MTGLSPTRLAEIRERDRFAVARMGNPDADPRLRAEMDRRALLAEVERLAAEVEAAREAMDHNVARIDDLRSLLWLVAERGDEFLYDEIATVLDDDPCDQWGDGYQSRLAAAESAAAEARADRDALAERVRALADDWERTVLTGYCDRGCGSLARGNKRRFIDGLRALLDTPADPEEKR